MDADDREAEACCPRCRGTGSGLYNVSWWLSTCEACAGTGRRATADPPPAAAMPPRPHAPGVAARA